MNYNEWYQKRVEQGKINGRDLGPIRWELMTKEGDVNALTTLVEDVVSELSIADLIFTYFGSKLIEDPSQEQTGEMIHVYEQEPVEGESENDHIFILTRYFLRPKDWRRGSRSTDDDVYLTKVPEHALGILLATMMDQQKYIQANLMMYGRWHYTIKVFIEGFVPGYTATTKFDR